MSDTLPPKVIHVIDSLGIGGAERLLASSLKVLPEYRHIVCFLCSPTDLLPFLQAERAYCLDFKSNYDFPKCIYRLVKILTREKPDIVHAHLLRSSWIARLANFGRHPFVFTVHNLLSDDAFKVNRLSLWVERLTCGKKQHLIAVSNAVLTDYKDWVNTGASSSVIYNVIDPEFFKMGAHAPKKVTGRKLRLVSVGNLRRQKNHQNLLQAFLHLKHVAVSLDIYGRGPLQGTLQAFIDEHELPVVLRGEANNLPSLLSGYDGFILASTFEGFGIAPVEAMAAGLPVLLSDLPVFREITGGANVFFEPNSPKAIAAAIEIFFAMPMELKAEMGLRNMQQAYGLSSTEVFRKQIIELYRSLM